MDETAIQRDDNTLGGEELTPKETFTRDDVLKIRNDAAAEIGRATKAAQESARIAEKAQERTTKFIKEARNAELEANSEEPDALARIRAMHEAEELRDELATANTKLSEIEGRDQQYTKENNAREIATQLNVDAKDLVELTDGSKEAMEKLAKKLPKLGEPRQQILSESGRTYGAGRRTFTRAGIAAMDEKEYAENKDAINQASREGLIRK